MFRVALRLLLAAALGAMPSLARADVYRWVDDSGATHYATSRDAVPRRYRDAAEVIKPPPPSVSNPSDARPPAAPPMPPAVEPAPAPVAPPPPTASSPAPEPSTPSSVPPAPSPPAPAPPDARSSAPVAPPANPPPAVARARDFDDPRAEEIAQLEGQIERDRDVLRELISTRSWDSADLAADPRVREIAERLPRLQAELAALRTEAGR